VKVFARTLTALGIAVALAACSGPAATPNTASPPAPASSVPSLPPRPAELRLDGVDPCTLLMSTQRSALGVGTGRASTTRPSDSTVQGASCLWLSLSQHPAEGYTATAVLNQGAEVALSAEPLRSVDGFAATTTTSNGSDPRHFCGLLVDVAPGQALSATYSDIIQEQTGLTRQAVCDKAQRLAEAMVTTLRALPHR
jgi:hypothetical protein